MWIAEHSRDIQPGGGEWKPDRNRRTLRTKDEHDSLAPTRPESMSEFEVKFRLSCCIRGCLAWRYAAARRPGTAREPGFRLFCCIRESSSARQGGSVAAVSEEGEGGAVRLGVAAHHRLAGLPRFGLVSRGEVRSAEHGDASQKRRGLRKLNFAATLAPSDQDALSRSEVEYLAS